MAETSCEELQKESDLMGIVFTMVLEGLQRPSQSNPLDKRISSPRSDDNLSF